MPRVRCDEPCAYNENDLCMFGNDQQHRDAAKEPTIYLSGRRCQSFRRVPSLPQAHLVHGEPLPPSEIKISAVKRGRRWKAIGPRRVFK